MRIRRRIIGWFRSLIYIMFLIVFGGGLILIGVYLPDIFGRFGIDERVLRGIGFGIIFVTVVFIIAMFETFEHL